MDAAEELRIWEHQSEAGPATSGPAAALPQSLPPSSAETERPAHGEPSGASDLILQAAGDGIYGLDAEGITTFANPAAEAMTGYLAGELIGKPQHAMIHHSYADGMHYPRNACPIYLALRDGLVHHSDTEVFWRKDGTSFPVVYTSTPILKKGRPIGATVVFRDISGRKRREAWEQSKNAIFLAITGNAELEPTLAMIADAFVTSFPSCAVALMTRKFGKLHLRAHAGLPERLQRELVSLNIADQGFASSRAAALRMEVLINRPPGTPASPKAIDPGTNQQGAIDDQHLPQCRELQASSFNACLSVPLLSADCEVLGVVAFFDADDETYDRQAMVSVSGVRDMARLAMEHQHLHAELVHQSQHDHLTGLPNRLLLEDRLERAILQAKRNGTQIAVCYLDLDHFKEINDTLGHNAGDSVLQHVTQVLKDCLRDIDTVARQGGDEFILILPGIKKEFEADEICERVLDRLRQPFEIGRQTVSVLASIGKCTYPLHGKTTTALLQNADIALYTAKRAGRARVQQYDSTQGEKVQRNIAIQRELRFALDREQFHVVYQPLFNMEAHLKGFEALLRWDHPELGVIGPDHFIPLAEESGIIGPIGEWVLNQACQQAQKWNLASVRPVKIYVNVSGVQLGQAQFTGAVAKALALSGLPPKLLDLEITETCIIADIDSACIRLKELRQLGIRISIDDFGCGHSSFSYLQQLPIDSIKIDRSFISCLDGTDKKSAIVRTIVALARELGLETVAEGVETGQQFEELQTTDCTMVQGFLLSRPLSPDDASQLLSFERGILPSKSAASLTANVSSVPLLP